MDALNVDNLRKQLSIEAKNGIDFTIAAAIIWAVISFVWQLEYSSYDKSVFVFIAGGPMFPLAFLFSKILKTKWKIPSNPLQTLGLWFNFAQLFYFPMLIFTLIKMPDYFIMVYAIITGAHFFPYAWFYKTKWYAVFAGIISAGNLFIGLSVQQEQVYYIGVFTSISLAILSVGLYFDCRLKKRERDAINATE